VVVCRGDPCDRLCLAVEYKIRPYFWCLRPISFNPFYCPGDIYIRCPVLFHRINQLSKGISSFQKDIGRLRGYRHLPLAKLVHHIFHLMAKLSYIIITHRCSHAFNRMGRPEKGVYIPLVSRVFFQSEHNLVHNPQMFPGLS